MSRGQVRPQIFILDFSKEKLVSSIKKLVIPLIWISEFGMRNWEYYPKKQMKEQNAWRKVQSWKLDVDGK